MVHCVGHCKSFAVARAHVAKFDIGLSDICRCNPGCPIRTILSSKNVSLLPSLQRELADVQTQALLPALYPFLECLGRLHVVLDVVAEGVLEFFRKVEYVGVDGVRPVVAVVSVFQ